MKDTELQIGDWMDWPKSPFANPHFYSQVVALERGGTSPCVGIPLTPEILEKNEWKEAQFWHEYQDGKNTIQSCLPDMRGIINGVEIQHFKCEYVHQYQHLLRLCGLNDLADNFKV